MKISKLVGGWLMCGVLVAMAQTQTQKPQKTQGKQQGRGVQMYPFRVVDGKREVTRVDMYPLRDALEKLKKGGTPAEEILSAASGVESAPARSAGSGLPLGVPLSSSAKEAVAISGEMLAERNIPAPGRDGKAVYTYGVGLPTIVCAPLHVCALELQAGEKLLGEPHIGDPVRWVIVPIAAGSGDAMVPLLAIKALLPGLDTTMMLATDRRVYYIRLMSDPQRYMAHTSFAYPDEPANQWNLFMAKQEQDRRQKDEATRIVEIGRNGIDKLNFRYGIVGNGPDEMRPVRAFDDGSHTYIQMPDEVAHMDMPALVVMVGKIQELVNYRVKNNMYVVDRLFSKGALLIGTGKQQRVFFITRKAGVADDGGR